MGAKPNGKGPNAVGISGSNNGKSSNHSRGSEATNGALVHLFEASEKVLHIDTSLVLLEQSEAKKHLSMILGVTAGDGLRIRNTPSASWYREGFSKIG